MLLHRLYDDGLAQAAGFGSVANLSGGYAGWRKAGLAVETGS